MYGGAVLGTATTVTGVAAIASLPNTGSHNIALGLALLSVAVGAAILASSVARIVAKRRSNV